MKNSLRTLRVLLVLWSLLQMQDCRGQALIGSSRPIVARVGDDVILPCFFRPPRDAAALTLEWTRPDMNPRFVFVWRSNEELTGLKHTQFVNRVFLFQDELKHGNISLKLTNVRPKDSGVYRCFIPAEGEETSVKLIIGSSSSVGVSVAAVAQWRAGVVLQCVSGGWFPEPELWWLDSEGRLLSVAHTLSLSDGLYDVSSRVTVEQSGVFSCTVAQSAANLTEQGSVQVSDTFFGVFPVAIGLTVGLVVFAGVAILFSILFFRTKQKQTRETSVMDSLNTRIASLEQEIKNNKLEDLPNDLDAVHKELKLLEKIQELRRQRDIADSKSPVIINTFNKWGTSFSLKNQSAETQDLNGWSVHIEAVDVETLIYTFESRKTLRESDVLTIWAEGCLEVENLYNKKWKEQDPWNIGEKAIVSLYDKHKELKDRICERMYPGAPKAGPPKMTTFPDINH